MNKVFAFYTALLNAWPMVIDFNLPQIIQTGKKVAPTRRMQLASFPVLGAICGLLLVLLGAFSIHVFNPIAGSLLFAVLATLFLELKDSGRGLGLFLSLVLNQFNGTPWRDSLPRLSTDLNRPLTSPLAIMFLSLLEISKLMLFFTLAFHDAKYWAVVVFCGSFAMQARLMLLPQSGSKVPFLAVSPDNRYMLWYGVAPFAVLALFYFPFATLAAAAFFFVFLRFAERTLDEEFQGVTANTVTLAGTITEYALLLIGIFLALHRLG
jgi:cobalamin synthase